MDIDKIIDAIEKYFRNFILYLLSFFKKEDDRDINGDDHETLNKTVIFATFSAVIGYYIWNRYIIGQTGKIDDIVGVVADNLLRWISIGLFLYAVLRLLRVHMSIISPVLLALRVLSVAHIVSIYIAYILISVMNFWLPYLATWQAAKYAYLANLIILWIYLTREILRLVKSESLIKKVVTIIPVFILVTVIGITPFASIIYDQTQAAKAKAGKPLPTMTIPRDRTKS